MFVKWPGPDFLKTIPVSHFLLSRTGRFCRFRQRPSSRVFWSKTIVQKVLKPTERGGFNTDGKKSRIQQGAKCARNIRWRHVFFK